MRFLGLSSLLAVLPLLGVAYVVLSGSLFTVDGLFMILMFLGISSVFGINALLEARGAGLIPGMKPAPAARRGGSAKGQGASEPDYGIYVASGTIRDLRFFEAAVGQQNKTLVEFVEDGSSTPRFVTFIGNVSDQLPVGSRVRITYRAEPEGNVLLARDALYGWKRKPKAPSAPAKASA